LLSGAGAARFDDLDDYPARRTFTPMGFVTTGQAVLDAELTCAKLPNVFILDAEQHWAVISMKND
jgi:hypothetical protein